VVEDAYYVYAVVSRMRPTSRGVGRILLSWAADRARPLGVTYVRLDFWADNPNLRAYYKGPDARRGIVARATTCVMGDSVASETMTKTDFATAASEEAIDAVAAALTANNIEAIVVDNGEEARERVLALVPEGAEVHWSTSKTLDDLGLSATFLESGRYDPIRPKYMAMDRATQGRQIRKLMAAPDVMLGSVQAVTLDGALVTVSYAGSQIGPYAAGAGRVILVVGSQKIVPDVDTAIRRVNEHVTPYEDARLRDQLGVGTRLAKLLVTFLEPRPGRTTVLLVREPVGV
jgi:LUD domain